MPLTRADHRARALASAFLAGDWAVEGMVERGATVVGGRRRWLRPLARAVLSSYPGPPADRPRELAAFVAAAGPFPKARVRRVPLAPIRMADRRPWPVPILDDERDLRALLQLTPGDLARDEYDRLKAVLHNCARSGPEAQNRAGHPDFRAHLLGRIGWLEQLNPARATRLRARFAEIAWG